MRIYSYKAVVYIYTVCCLWNWCKRYPEVLEGGGQYVSQQQLVVCLAEVVLDLAGLLAYVSVGKYKHFRK